MTVKKFAKELHKDQKWNIYPYEYHLYRVVEKLDQIIYTSSISLEEELKQTLIDAAWCHDTLEDCNISYNDLKKVVGEKVADIVYDVTNELGKNRKERNERTYPKIRKNWAATIVKIADRMANSEGPLFDMYKSEFPSFKEGIYNSYWKNDPLYKNAWNLLEKMYEKK